MRRAGKSAQAHPVAKSKAHEKGRAGVLPHSNKKTTAAAATTSGRTPDNPTSTTWDRGPSNLL